MWQSLKIILIVLALIAAPIVAQIIIMILWPDQAVTHDQIGPGGSLWGNG